MQLNPGLAKWQGVRVHLVVVSKLLVKAFTKNIKYMLCNENDLFIYFFETNKRIFSA